MAVHREHAQLQTSLEEAWALIGNPASYPRWWPRVIELHGERFELGDEYVQVTSNPTGRSRTTFVIERRDELREIRMRCQLTGTYAHWWLTAAQGGTFVELELGMEPRRLGDRMFDATLGRRYFQRWSEKSLEALRDAAEQADRPPAKQE